MKVSFSAVIATLALAGFSAGASVAITAENETFMRVLL